MNGLLVQELRFGTRGSALAMWQTRHVIDLLQAATPELRVGVEEMQSRGDRILDTPLPLIGGKGLFTAELERALRETRIDCAVHSLKDLPVETPEGLVIGAVPRRASASDALVSRNGFRLETLPTGARVGTCSHRRAAQLLAVRPDLTIVNIRGNVDSRIRKALDPVAEYDAIVLAVAGLERLGRQAAISEVLDLEVMLPAPGQGAIAVQTRDDPRLVLALSVIADVATTLAVVAERAFLAGLGGGCSAPIAAWGRWENGQLTIHGRVLAMDGSSQIDVTASVPARQESEAIAAGHALALDAIAAGAGQLLEP